jgi:hypothetical protein
MTLLFIVPSLRCKLVGWGRIKLCRNKNIKIRIEISLNSQLKGVEEKWFKILLNSNLLSVANIAFAKTSGRDEFAERDQSQPLNFKTK